MLHIRLESPLERPEERKDFKHADLLGWVRSQRPKLVAAALTVLRAYWLAGKPTVFSKPWGSFTGWQELVCGALVWLGLPDPSETRLGLSGSDAQAGLLGALLDGWGEIDPHGQGVTAAEALRRLDAEPTKYSKLRDSISELCPSRPGQLPDALKLGCQLRTFKGRVQGNRKFELRPGHQSVARWFVPRLQEAGDAAADVGGDGGGNGGGDVAASGSAEAVSAASEPSKAGVSGGDGGGGGGETAIPESPEMTATTSTVPLPLLGAGADASPPPPPVGEEVDWANPPF